MPRRGTIPVEGRPCAMKRPTLVLGLALAATLFGACSGGSAPNGSPSSPPGAAAGDLNGKTYLSTGIKGATLAPGTQIRLAFKDGNLSANAGCNAMGGTYTISGDQLSATQMSMTDMACEEPRMKQDDWLARFLSRATISLSGDTLTLTAGTVVLTVTDKEIATPDLPILATRWILDGITSGDTASSIPVGVAASIRIVDGKAEVASGCNTGTGAVEVKPDALTFGPIGLTKKGCEPETMAVERAVTAVLAGTVGYAIDADVLTINAGNAGLTFRAAP
jgi:heat shock protein HslJ